MKKDTKKTNGNHVLRNIVGEKTVYHGAIIDVRVDEVKFPSGQIKNREVVLHRQAVAIIAADADGSLYLVSQYRHAVDEDLLEVPAGIVEEGEDPRDAAIRELQEEIGHKPGSIEEIFTLYTAPDFSNEEVIFYYAYDLTKSELPQDEDEFIEVKKYNQAELDRLIESGALKDGKTMIALYWYRNKKQAEQCR